MANFQRDTLSRSSRVAAGREGSLLRPLVPASKLSERGLPRVGRPWPGSILLSFPQNSPQLKRVANATDNQPLGKTARASSGLATLPQTPNQARNPVLPRGGRCTLQSQHEHAAAAVPRTYQTACAARAQAPRFGYLYGTFGKGANTLRRCPPAKAAAAVRS